jgi:TIR domain/NB-ARC domain
MAVKIFFCYAHEDEELLKKLKTHLRPLQRQGLIDVWHDRDIRAGAAWEQEISKHLNTAQIILLLVSPDFMDSDYCYGIEMTRALERHEAGEACVIPVILRPCDWQHDPALGSLLVLPTDGKPLITWPSPPYYDTAFEDIAKGIRKVVEDLRTDPVQMSSRPAQVWSIPMHRNLFFTGREQLLEQLHNRLTTTKATDIAQPQAISGLGGIGKTQIAVEYAYRYGHEYRYVLWASATSSETLLIGLRTITELLKLPERSELDQLKVVVNRWLSQHTNWLLILDNADDLNLVRDVLPTMYSGHILLTTRAYTVGSLAHRMVVQEMGLEEGTRFLLRRADILKEEKTLERVPDAIRAQAEAIVMEMAGLPLALEQVGAYLEETGFGISGYLNLYRQRRTELLKRKGKFSPEYPYTVATTWSLSFQRVEQDNPAAADLLRLFTILNIDVIFESMITDAASALGARLKPVVANPIKLNEAIQVLLSYSLVRRDPATQTLSIHRLVQQVLRDDMKPEIQQQWEESAILVHLYRFQSIKSQLLGIKMQLSPPANLRHVGREVVEQLINDLEQSINYLYAVIKGMDEMNSHFNVLKKQFGSQSIGKVFEMLRMYVLTELYSSLYFLNEGDIQEYYRCLFKSSDYLEEAVVDFVI